MLGFMFGLNIYIHNVYIPSIVTDSGDSNTRCRCILRCFELSNVALNVLSCSFLEFFRGPVSFLSILEKHVAKHGVVVDDVVVVATVAVAVVLVLLLFCADSCLFGGAFRNKEKRVGFSQGGLPLPWWRMAPFSFMRNRKSSFASDSALCSLPPTLTPQKAKLWKLD